jgi:hypothetical protein
MSLTTFQALGLSRTKQGGGGKLAVLPQTRIQKFLIFRILIDKQTEFNEQSISVRDIMTTDKYLHFVVHSREFRHKKHCAKVNPKTGPRSVL